MKFTTCLLALISSAQFLQAKAYILDEKNYHPPKGVVFEEVAKFGFENGKIFINRANRVVNGVMKRTGVEETSVTNLGGAKFLSIIKKSNKTNQVIIDGKAMPEEIKKSPLIGESVIYRKINGVWSASEKDNKKLNEEQQEEIDKELKKLNEDTSAYGYRARRLGETWKLEKALLKKLVGDGKMEKMVGTVTLKEIVDIDGYECAKLLCKIEVVGVKDGIKLSLKGDVTVWRNLKYFIDVKARGDLETVIEPNAQAKITANSIITEDVSIKEPAVIE